LAWWCFVTRSGGGVVVCEWCFQEGGVLVMILGFPIPHISGWFRFNENAQICHHRTPEQQTSNLFSLNA
jgi:hypothetical protein